LVLFFKKEHAFVVATPTSLTLKRTTIMLKQGLAFVGFFIEATDGKMGTVSDFLFDEKTWTLRWLVVDTGTWLTGRKLLLHPSAIQKADMDVKALLVNLTRVQVEKSPSIETDEPVSRQMEQGLYSYYGVDPLWGGAYYGGNGLGMTMTSGNVGSADKAALAAGHADPHLRSLVEVTGYAIEATDGAIGHIESFLIDDAHWDIRYLVADTSNWWFGRHVLLSPASVLEICWETHKVRLNLTGYKIKGSPPWDPTGLLDRAYERVLQAYYAWPARFLPDMHSAPPEAGQPPVKAPEPAVS
jgi:hypothetical protein